MDIFGVVNPRKGSARTKASGAAAASLEMVAGQNSRVVLHLKTYDVHDIMSVFGIVSMSRDEALALAATLTALATEQE